jgi:hypothetical protein
MGAPVAVGDAELAAVGEAAPPVAVPPAQPATAPMAITAETITVASGSRRRGGDMT